MHSYTANRAPGAYDAGARSRQFGASEHASTGLGTVTLEGGGKGGNGATGQGLQRGARCAWCTAVPVQGWLTARAVDLGRRWFYANTFWRERSFCRVLSRSARVASARRSPGPLTGPCGARSMSDIASKRYKILQTVGSGAYGVVHRAVDVNTGNVVALKSMKCDFEDDGVPGTALREIAVLRLLQHPNIVRLMDVEHGAHSLCLAFEFVEQDLRKHMAATRKDPVDFRLATSFARQMLLGVEYCHSRGVMHRDLKPENVLVGADGTLKIADFGLSRAFGLPLKPLTLEVVTLWYRAPEILLGAAHYSVGVDVWAAGCIFAELFRRKPLWVRALRAASRAVRFALRAGPCAPLPPELVVPVPVPPPPSQAELRVRACVRAPQAGDSEIDTLFKIFQLLGTPSTAAWPGLAELPHHSPVFPRWPAQLLTKKVKELGGCSSGVDLLQVRARAACIDSPGPY